MTREIRLRRAGGSIGATLPKEMVKRFHLDAGDRVFAIETEDGILITPYDATLSRALEIAREGAAKYRHALRELAK